LEKAVWKNIKKVNSAIKLDKISNTELVVPVGKSEDSFHPDV
jgi:hypothetical protein